MLQLKILTVSILLLCFLLTFCSHKEGLSPAEENLLVSTTAQISLAAQEYAGETQSLSARQDSIFSSVGLDRESYHQLVEKMNLTPERWAQVWERITERIQQMTAGRPQEGAGQ